MKLIDPQNDYFLHDFNNKEKDSGNDPQQTTEGQESRPQTDGNEFSFTGNDDDTTSKTEMSRPAAESPARRRRRGRMRWFWFFLILLAVAVTAFYIRYFVPYTSDTLTSGYIVLVEKRGIFFKTFEGEMISENMLADTTKVYSRDFYFSIPNDSLARVVQSYQGTGRRVTVTTQKYYGTLPWRGSQRSVVTAIAPAAPATTEEQNFQY